MVNQMKKIIYLIIIILYVFIYFYDISLIFSMNNNNDTINDSDSIVLWELKDIFQGGPTRMVSMGYIGYSIPDPINIMDLYSENYVSAIFQRPKANIISLSTGIYFSKTLNVNKKGVIFNLLSNNSDSFTYWQTVNDVVILKPYGNYCDVGNNYFYGGEIQYAHKFNKNIAAGFLFGTTNFYCKGENYAESKDDYNFDIKQEMNGEKINWLLTFNYMDKTKFDGLLGWLITEDPVAINLGVSIGNKRKIIWMPAYGSYFINSPFEFGINHNNNFSNIKYHLTDVMQVKGSPLLYVLNYYRNIESDGFDINLACGIKNDIKKYDLILSTKLILFDSYKLNEIYDYENYLSPDSENNFIYSGYGYGFYVKERVYFGDFIFSGIFEIIAHNYKQDAPEQGKNSSYFMQEINVLGGISYVRDNLKIGFETGPENLFGVIKIGIEIKFFEYYFGRIGFRMPLIGDLPDEEAIKKYAPRITYDITGGIGLNFDSFILNIGVDYSDYNYYVKNISSYTHAEPQNYNSIGINLDFKTIF